MAKETICATPDCDNTLTEEQSEKGTPVCLDCETANMHHCEICSKELSRKRIENGASLCKECEMNPSRLETPGVEEEYGSGPEEFTI